MSLSTALLTHIERSDTEKTRLGEQSVILCLAKERVKILINFSSSFFLWCNGQLPHRRPFSR